MATQDIFPQQHSLSRTDRSVLKGHQPLVLWLTGYSGSGKSSIANALELRLNHEFQAHTVLLDGDNIRSGLNSDLGFSEHDRKENNRRVGEVAKLFFEAGLIVITAFISPYQADREAVRAKFGEDNFWEIYVACSLETCIRRDPKNLYQKAIAGETAEFTGIQAPYEIPINPDIILDTEQLGIDECVEKIIQLMLEKKFIQAGL